MNEDITNLLHAASTGDSAATNELYAVVYAELHAIASGQRRHWQGDYTLDTTAIVHEAFLKLNVERAYVSRKHFYATAAKAMRQVLINYAERRRAAKRGGDEDPVPFDESLVPTEEVATELLELHEALGVLEADKPRWVNIFELRFFAGLTVQETASTLEISPATVDREWRSVTAWLVAHINPASTLVATEP